MGQAQDVSLFTWFDESYPSIPNFPDGVWVVAEDGLSVTQVENGQRTLFCSDFPAMGSSWQGVLDPLIFDEGTNDKIGFALGFNRGDSTNPNADYLLIDWQKNAQTSNMAGDCTPGATAERGLAISRVRGVLTADEFGDVLILMLPNVLRWAWDWNYWPMG